MTRLTLRLDFDDKTRLGPGKVVLLEQIAATGSISAAARALGMSYRRAWLLVDAMNHSFRTHVVATRVGGSNEGRAQLTEFGREVVSLYRSMESAAHEAAAGYIARLEGERPAGAGETATTAKH